MHDSHVWGIRSNNPSKKERMAAAVEKLVHAYVTIPDESVAIKCYNKVVELSRKGLW